MISFSRIPWVTYRSNFRPVLSLDERSNTLTEITSDVGWGCTIRVGQMMLLTTIQRVLHTPRWPNFNLLRLVQEYWPEAPYSLHSVAGLAPQLNWRPGEWLSPSSICFALEVSFIQMLLNNQTLHRLKAKVFIDGVIYRDQLWATANGFEHSVLMNLCRCSSQEDAEFCSVCSKQIASGHWESGVLVLLPLMLGLNKVQPKYYRVIKQLLNMPESVGIIGGRPRSALYFVGSQDDSLVFLDPHIVQPACTSDDDLASSLNSFMCESARLLPLKKMQSSMSVGFYFDNDQSFTNFQRCMEYMKTSLKSIVTVVNSTPSYLCEDRRLDDSAVLDDSDDYIILEDSQ